MFSLALPKPLPLFENDRDTDWPRIALVEFDVIHLHRRVKPRRKWIELPDDDG